MSGEKRDPTVHSRHEDGERAVVVQHEDFVRGDGKRVRRLVRAVERKLHGGKWVRESVVTIRASELRSTIDGLTKALKGEPSVNEKQGVLL